MPTAAVRLSAPPGPETRSPVRWLVLAGVWFIYACFGVTVTGLAPLVGPITRDLGLSHSAMGGVLGVWQLVYIAWSVPCGFILDRLGARRALFLGALLIAGSGLARGLAIDYLTLCAAVALFGFGGPIVSAGAPKVISLWFQGRERGLAMGLYITGPSAGGVVSLALTNSVMMPLFDGQWRHVLFLWAALMLASGLVWLVVTQHPIARGVEQRIAAEPKRPQRQILAEILSLPAVRLMLVMSVGIFLFNHALNNWLPELLHHGGLSAVAAGYWSAVPTAVGVFGSLLIPRLAVPERRFTVLTGLCLAAGLASLCLHAAPGPVLMFGLILQGLVRGSLMTVAILTLVEMRGVGEKNAGTASGLFFSAAEVGGASGPVVLGVLYDATGSFDAGLHLLTGITVALVGGVLWLRRLVALQAVVARPDAA
ncbi:MAG: MFS transporter [Alphaproteobacteria bacterium]|nr:MFS transporter [Alphaproteobacteria bacterium]